MLGEHRPPLSDLLCDRAQLIIKSISEMAKDQDMSKENESLLSALTEDQCAVITTFIKEIKTPDEILVRAKSILRRHTDQN